MMPIYFFNIRNDDRTDDFEGVDLADEHAALAFAVQAARSLAADTVGRGHLYTDHYVEIVDESRETIGKVTFGDAVVIR
jgi:hypothetical protein